MGKVKGFDGYLFWSVKFYSYS